ncbi:MAG: hypothetical protein QMC37_00280 [Flavobacteriales bacterium]
MLRRIRKNAEYAAFSRLADGGRSARLEEGKQGIPYDLKYQPPSKLSLSKILFAAVFLFTGIWTLAMLGDGHVEQMRLKVMRQVDFNIESSCVPIGGKWVNVVGFPSIKKYITHPKIMSSSGDMVYAAETLDILGCEEKIIYRSRHLAVTVRHGSLDSWPLGTSRRTTTFVREQAVCVQHAIEVLRGNINCSSI